MRAGVVGRVGMHRMRGGLAGGVVADPAATLPAVAALASGEWWDSTASMVGSTLVGRSRGLVLTANQGTPTLVPNVLNGRPAIRSVDTARFRGMVTPIGVSPSAFSVYVIGRGYTNYCNLAAILAGTPGNEPGYIDVSIYGRNGNVWSAEVFSTSGAPDFTVTGDVYSEYSADENLPPASDSPTANGPALFEVHLANINSVPTFFLNGQVVGADPDQTQVPFNPFAFSFVEFCNAFGPETGNPESDAFLLAAFPVMHGTTDRQKMYDWVTAVYGLTLPAAT